MPPKKNKQALGMADMNARAAAQASPTAPREDGVENAPTEAATKSKKRKSTDAATTNAPVAKKAKAVKAAKAPKPIPDSLDVSGVSLDDEDEDGDIPVYDTCDTIRRKIRALLAKDGVTQAAFLRAIAAAAFEDGSRKIQSASLTAFMRQKGPLAGNTSTVYYAAYVFFEKLRIKQRKPKSADREIMEELHPGGVDRKVQSGKVAYVVGANSRIGMDKYGRIVSY